MKQSIKLLCITLFLLIITPSATTYAMEQGVAGIARSLDALCGAVPEALVQEDGNSDINRAIEDYSLLYEVDADLVRAVICAESDGVVRAYNENGNGSTDRGLMQINSCNYEWLEDELGITDWYDPKQNIQAGTYMLSLLSVKYGDLHKVLMAYNMGADRMRELWSKGITSSKYSRKVMGKFNQLKEGGK
jgi:soluble lytic murein transglycosylase-like protein